jgi:hypothetical protein
MRAADECQPYSTKLLNSCKPLCRPCATGISIVVPDANGKPRHDWPFVIRVMIHDGIVRKDGSGRAGCVTHVLFSTFSHAAAFAITSAVQSQLTAISFPGYSRCDRIYFVSFPTDSRLAPRCGLTTKFVSWRQRIGP